MKCLKIPNTIHFKDVTSINDALALHEKLNRESQEAQFRPDLEEEFEDNEGNILNKRTFYDMKKQGLIDWSYCCLLYFINKECLNMSLNHL